MSNPTNGVWQFDGDAGDWVITGPERYDNGLWLEEATTNLAANPSFETDTTGWAVDFAVLTRQTSWSSEGAASGRLRRNSVVDAIDAYTATAIGTVDPGDSVTYSIDLNASVAMTGLRLAMTFRTAANANISTTNGTLFAGGPGELGRQSLTATAPANSSYVRVFVVHTVAGGTIGDDLFMDGVQIEKKAYATSYADNTLGAGYGGSSGAYTRAASSSSVPTAGHLDPSSGAIAFRVTPTIETGLEELWGECGTKGSGTDHVQWGRDASTHPFVEWSANNAAYQRLTGTETLAAGTECLFYTDWDGTAIRLSIDNGTIQTDTRDAVSDSWGAGDLVLKAE